MSVRDLLLEYRTGERNNEVVNAVLANIPGQRYTFGSQYPGERKGEEFIFCRGFERGVVNPTHCAISVDEQGQYWIQNDTTYADGRATRSSIYNTFVNSERVQGVERRLLKIGDMISLGAPETEWPRPGRPLHPIYHVKERIVPPSNSNTGPHIEETGAGAGNEEELKNDAESPFDNNLILSEIMAYLSIPDLKNARQVSKKWKEEGSKVIEKKAMVSFDFKTQYLSPEYSTRVSRYLLEVRGLKIRNFKISLQPTTGYQHNLPNSSLAQDPLRFPPGEPGEKMMNDLRKLFNSSQVSTLFLDCDIKNETDFLPFSLIFEELGGKLEELHLTGDVAFLPALMPPFPVMSNLQKFSHKRWFGFPQGIRERWTSHLVPLFANSLEHVGYQHLGEVYVREILKHDMPKLKGIETARTLGFSLLMELRNSLTSLKIEYLKYSDEDCSELERFLLKHSTSLKHLVISVGQVNYKTMGVRFPSFPNLEELDLEYGSSMRISWGIGSLDYRKHLPSLRKLKIKPGSVDDDRVFDSFFPEEGAVRCETLKYLWIHSLPDPADRWCPQKDFQPRIDKIKEMFPSALNMKFTVKESRSSYAY